VTDKTITHTPPPPVSPPRVAATLSVVLRHADDLVRHADDLLASGEREQALAHLRQLIQDFPKQTRGYLRIASLLKEERRWKEAQEILKVAVKHAPGCHASWRALVEVCLEIGAYEEVLGYAQRLLKHQPRSLFAHDALIAVYTQRGQMERALSLLGQRLRLTPCDPWIHFQQGALRRHVGDVAGATRSFERALQYAQEADLASDIELALEVLERYQVHQIVMLASEDMAFSLQIHQLSEEKVCLAVQARGFYLSATGLGLLNSVCRQSAVTASTPSSVSKVRQYQ
jgi:tetratricopeptide (TPR) repeat protein